MTPETANKTFLFQSVLGIGRFWFRKGKKPALHVCNGRGGSADRPEELGHGNFITSQFGTPEKQISTTVPVAIALVSDGLTATSSQAIADCALTRWINTDDWLRRFKLVMATLIAGTGDLLIFE